MAKEDKSIWLIFFEGIKIFALNIHKFLLYMAFPVLGQLLGLVLIFGLTYWFTRNYQNLAVKYTSLNDFSTMLTVVIITVIPGLLIWARAFWDYLVAYVAINSMTEGYLNTGRVYDFTAHNEIVTKRTFSFIALWLLFSIFCLVSFIPVFWIIGAVFFVYFLLIFQVFTYEDGISPVGIFKRSLNLIKGKFARTFLLMALLTIFTYYFLPAGLSVIFDSLNLTGVFAKIFEAWAYTLPLPLEVFQRFNISITPELIGKEMVSQLVFFIVVGFTLPVRSICWTLWYKNLYFDSSSEVIEKKRKSSKKVSAKTFKIEKRGIDPEIIRRARLEDDEY